LTVNGTGFVSGAAVLWSGVIRPTTFVSSAQLTAAIPAADIAFPGSGYIDVSVPKPGGGTTLAPPTLIFQINSPNSVPTLTSLNPGNIHSGGPAFTLTVNGTHFVSGATVRWNGAARATTFVSSTQITAAITAADIASAGWASVQAMNPWISATSNSLFFQIQGNNSLPTLTSLSPASATAGGPAFTLTVNGTNFVSGAVVRWNSVNRATTFVSAAQLTAVIGATDIASPGSANITVFNPVLGGGTSNGLALTISSPNPVPTMTELSPSITAAGGRAFTLTVTGSSFVSGATVRWNGVDRTTTFVNGTRLTADIAAADIAAIATADVTVFNPAPGGGASSVLPFSVTTPQPIVTIELNRNTFLPGDAVEASLVRFENPRSTPAPVEVKLWLEMAGSSPISILNIGADGAVTLPAGVQFDLGPVKLFDVGSSTPSGIYAFSSRIVDPVSGELLSEDPTPFSIVSTALEAAEEPGPLAPEVAPQIEVALNKSTFTVGDLVTANLRIHNPTPNPMAVEIKVWHQAPGAAPTQVLDAGADSSIVLPVLVDLDLAPLPLWTVTADTSPGNHEFGGRLLNPVTGKQYSRSVIPFVIR
jgi:hypothetical protein